MANLSGNPAWPGVYQIEQEDPVVGGAPNPDTRSGMANIPHLQLFQRTEFLRTLLGGLGETLSTVDNLNTLTTTGARHYQDGSTGSPTTPGGLVFHFEMPGMATQIIVSSDGTIYGRARVGNPAGWTQWRKVWHQSNDGAGSGLDADTVDGRQASEFVLLAGLIEAIRNVDGSGSGLDADLLDGAHRNAFVEKDGATMTGSLTLPGNPSANLHAATKAYVDAQRDTRMTQTQADGRYLRNTGGNVSGSIYATGTLFSHGDEVLVWSDTPFAVDSVVQARYTGSVEKMYGSECDGNLLQPAAASGNDNNGPIGIGTWVCMGYASGSASASPAERTCSWYRKY